MIRPIQRKQDKFVFLLIVFSLILSVILIKQQTIYAADENPFAGGDGTAESPYLIETAEQLDEVRKNLTAHYKLIADIDLSAYENWEPIGNSNLAFQGNFDGNGHKIKNLTITGNAMHVGLFGYVLSTKEVAPVIKNIQLENVNISLGENIGGLIGFIDTEMYEDDEGDMVHPNPTIVNNIIVKGQVHQGSAANGGTNGTGLLIGKSINVSITNVEVTGYVRGAYRIGGLIGYAPRQTSIINSSFSGDVDGTVYYIGGLVGRLGSGSTVIGSSSEGSVFGTSIVGGITGYMTSGIINESYSTSYVEAKEGLVGGLVGRFDPNTSDPLTITKSFATGDVRGTSSVGGLIGNTYHLSRAVIENTFATGNVTGTGNTVGGLIGMHDYGHLKNSYAIGRVISDEGRTPGGLVGSVGNSPTVSGSYYNTETSGQNDDEGKGIPTSDAAMKNQDTFDGWDFNNVWRIDPNSDYPYPTFDFTSHVPDFSQQGDVVYVKEGALGKGHSWDSPLGNLEIALLMAERDENIKEIWIAEGTYVPTRRPIGSTGNLLTRNEYRHFQMVNDVTIYGGFPASGNPSLLERDPTAHETILSGDIYRNDDGSESSQADNIHHVFYHPDGSNIDETAVLDGVTITGGRATGLSGGANQGGGMYNYQASPTLRNVVFASNHADEGGGGMYNGSYSTPSLENVTFKDNTALHHGGGIHNLNSSPTIMNAKFINNEAYQGGAIYNQSQESKPILKDVVFIDNEADNAGGGFYNYNGAHPTLINVVFENNVAFVGGAFASTPFQNYFGPVKSLATLQNVLFKDNYANSIGGALYLIGSGEYELKNVTISGNRANQGSGLYVASSNENIPDITIQNSILWGDEEENLLSINNSNLTISHSIIEGSGGSDNWDDSVGIDGGNNLDENPLFVDQGDYTLQASSPAINAGNNDYILAGVTTDLAGSDRILNGTVDLGAYEFAGEVVEEPTLDSITVEPESITLQLDVEGNPFDVVSEYALEDIEVTAHYSDGKSNVVKAMIGFNIDQSEIATIDDGKVIAQQVGETKLTVIYEDQEAEVQVTVVEAPELDRIEILSMNEMDLLVNEKRNLKDYFSSVAGYYTNVPEVENPVNIDLDELTISSDDDNIVAVEPYLITGIAPGKTNVNLGYEGKSASIAVTVRDHLYFTETEYEVEAGSTLTPTLMHISESGTTEANSNDVTYRTHDQTVATVDEEGNVAAVGAGITKLTVTLKDDIVVVSEAMIVVYEAEVVYASTDKEIEFNDVAIKLNAGAVEEETIIKVKPVTEEEQSAREPATKDFASAVYKLSKSKKDVPPEQEDSDEPSFFNKPITLTFSFDNKTYKEADFDVGIFWYNEETEQWEALENTIVDWENGRVSGTIDHFTLFTVLATEKESTNKTALLDKIEEAERYEAESYLYTEESMNNLRSAIENAVEIYEKEEATQEEVDQLVDYLEAAINSLVKVEVSEVDKTELENLLENTNEMEEARYTAESYANLQAVIIEAKAVLLDDEATQEEVAEQFNSLRAAIEALVEVDEQAEVSKTMLENRLLIAESYQEENYTEQSFRNLTNAIEAAESVLTKEEATADEVETALENLQAAIDSLETYEVKTEIETVEIDFVTVKEEDDTLEEGKQVVTQKGKNGQKTITYEVTYVNGEEVEREKVAEEITEPIDEIIKIGTKKPDDGEVPVIPTDPEPSQIKVEFGKTYEINANDTVIIQIDGLYTTINMPDELPNGTKIVVEEAGNRGEVTAATNLNLAGDILDVSITDGSGNKIEGPFILTMAYDKDQYEAADVDIYYYDETKNQWIKQNGEVDEASGTITVTVPHFSMYGVFAEADESTRDDDSSSDDQGGGTVIIEPEDSDQTVGEAGTTGSKSEDSLPNTATNIFNMIAIGLALLLVGAVSYIYIRRKTV